MYTLIKYDRIIILQNYGIYKFRVFEYGVLEIPCSIPWFRIAITNVRKKTTENFLFRSSVSVD